MSRDNFHRKSGAAIPLGGEWGLAAVLFEQSAHLLDASPVRKAFPAFAGTSFERHSGRPLRHASFYDASCLNVIVPGVLRVPIDVIVMNGDLRDVIRDGWGSRPACAVYANRRVMDFGRRPGSCQP